MNANDREIRRKQRILEYAVESGNVAKTCRYFGIPRIARSFDSCARLTLTCIWSPEPFTLENFWVR